MNKPIRIGVVGLGKIAQAQHLPEIAANENFELAFVVDRAVELDLDVPSFKSLSDALNADMPFDAISVCTSPQVRYELCELLFETDAAILLEKPAASNYALARDIEKRARDMNQCLFATWHSRFAPHIQAATEWVAENELQSGQITWRENVRKWHPGQDWIWRDGGFGVFDPGMNALSILTQIVPVHWSLGSAELQIPNNVETPNRATFTLKHRHIEVGAHFEFHEHDEDDWTIRLTSKNGGLLELYDGGAGLRINNKSVKMCNPLEEYALVYQRFYDLIKLHQIDCDLAPLRIIEDIVEAATVVTNQPITI